MIFQMVPPAAKFKSWGAIASEILYRLPAIVFFLWFAWFLVLLSDRSSPATLTEGKMISETAKPGHPIKVQFSVNRSRICRVQYLQTFYDSTNTRFIIPSYTSLGNRGIVHGQKLTLGLMLPKGMATGPARYESERQYSCNWTQLIIPVYEPNPTIYFTVNEPDDEQSPKTQ